MKNFRILYFMLLAFSFSACDDWLDVNKDPNNPTDITPELVLSSGINRTADYYTSELNIIGNLYMGNICAPYDFIYWTSEEQYNLNANTYNDIWVEIYSGALADLNYVEEKAVALELPNFVAIARIMKAFNFSVAADLWGDIPLTEALQGGTGGFSPTYTSSIDVYQQIITMINAGLDQIDTESGAVYPASTSDIMFGGDMEMWRKFANSLKMRLLIRISGETNLQSFINSEFDKIVNDPAGVLGTGEYAAVNPGYNSSTDKQTPIYKDYGFDGNGSVIANWNALRANEYALSLLQANNDPRYATIYGPVPGTDDEYAGLPQGTTESSGDYNAEFTSPYGDKIIGLPENEGYARDAYLFTPMESLFLQAEAIQRGYMDGDAGALYEAAITESFLYHGFDELEAETYYTQNASSISWEASTDKIEAIIVQKWIALNGINGIELFNEYRRTGYPDVPLSVDPGRVIDHLPYRFPYVQDELATNGANVPKGVSYRTDKLFWAEN